MNKMNKMNNMNKLTSLASWLATIALTFSMISSSFAQTGDIVIRTTVITASTHASSRTLRLDVGNATSVAVDGTYFVTPNIGINVLATFLNTEVKAKSLGSLGSVDLLPPIFTVQYHFAPEGQIRPYAGLGFNYNHFYRYSGTLKTVNAKIDDKVGFVAQLGLDYMLSKTLSLNADLKYLDVRPDVKTTLGNDKLNLRATIFGVGLGYRF